MNKHKNSDEGCNDPRCSAHHKSEKELRKWHADNLRKYGFYAHYVFDAFVGEPHPVCHLANYHTHGFDDTWGHPDFQIVLPMKPETALNLFWTLAHRVKTGEKFEAGKLYDGVAGPPYKIRLVEAEEAGRKVLRVLIPDVNNKLPGDKGVEPTYAVQTDAP